MALNRRPEDYNAFGYDPNGRVANAGALLFGPQWRPDQQDLPRHPEVTAPRYGPPADYQVPYLPPHFVPQPPPGSYLAHPSYHPAVPLHPPYGHWIPYPPPGLPVPQQVVDQLPAHPQGESSSQNSTRTTRSSMKKATYGEEGRLHKDEVRKGVFRFIVFINRPDRRREFTIESDIEHADLFSRACANLDLDPTKVELGYRIAELDGKTSPPGEITTEAGFRAAMNRMCEVISRSKTRTKSMEIMDITPKEAPVPKKKTKKRSRDDDVPNNENLDEVTTPQFKKLLMHTECQRHKGHCYPQKDGTHKPLDVQDLTYWAKEIALGNATLDLMPNLGPLDPDRRKRYRPNPRSTSTSTEIHVHLNDLGAGLRFGGSTLGNRDGNVATAIFKDEKFTQKDTDELPPPPPPYTSVDPLLPLIDDVLATLEISDPGKKYMDMLEPLKEAGVHNINDLLDRSSSTLVEWTGLDACKIESVTAYARSWKILGDMVKNTSGVGVTTDKTAPK